MCKNGDMVKLYLMKSKQLLSLLKIQKLDKLMSMLVFINLINRFLNWDGENHSLEETVLPSLVNRRNLNCYVYNGNFIDIGVPDDYKKFVGIYNEEKNI